MGEIVAFGGPVDYEDFYMRRAVVMFEAFVEWLRSQSDGESLVADLSLVDEALSEDYQGEMRLAIEAVQRLVQVARRWPGSSEMGVLLTTVRDLWEVAYAVEQRKAREDEAYGCCS